eukprot:TRINITY_DN4846_c0_g3_i2.p1 TRINITY_DN4846_c0_g3~~TRINITY_DN4846_c0_g3_i2.p1  ORF type:complete len:422 (-),score=92.48 TRINITY_DN4846_c0_g3_i2:162-1427(-)
MSSSSSSSSFLTHSASPKFVGVLFYIGYEYCGWQTQKGDEKNEDSIHSKNLPTIQETFENAIKFVTGKEKISVISSGRTDAGTHSSGQVIHFILDDFLQHSHHNFSTTTSTNSDSNNDESNQHESNENNSHKSNENNNNFDLKDFIFQMNQQLPRDIRLLNLSHFPSDFPPHITQFHAKKSVIRKQYSYYIQQGTFMIDWAPFCWYMKKIDLDVWKEELSYLLGLHDFREFSTQKEARKTVLEIFSINVSVLQQLNPYFPTDPKRVADNCSNSQKKPSYLLSNEQSKIDPNNPPTIVRIQIVASGFLKHMIRRIVGTLYNIQDGRKKRGLFKELIEMGNTPSEHTTELPCLKRKSHTLETGESSSSTSTQESVSYRGGKGASQLGKSAPSRGLWLENVEYTSGANPYHNLDEKNLNWTPFI